MRLPTLLLILCLLALGAGLAFGSDVFGNTSSSEMALPRYDNVTPHGIGAVRNCTSFDGILLAGQPEEADFALLKQAGVGTVLNIRHSKEIPFDEQAAVERAGMAYVQVPFGSPDELTDEVFDRYRELLNETQRPLMLHCGSANRVGAVWMAWRVLDGGLDLDAAAAEAREVGLKSEALADKARSYIARKQG